MNKYKMYVAGLTTIIEATGSEYTALSNTGLFQDITMIKAYCSHPQHYNSWLYQVKLNNKPELVMIEKIEKN